MRCSEPSNVIWEVGWNGDRDLETEHRLSWSVGTERCCADHTDMHSLTVHIQMVLQYNYATGVYAAG